ncbi:MAG: sensor histidine kinase [Chloroflexi bacterium]|nr:sensor histidine kinase [Chloroflexota bacterium]
MQSQIQTFFRSLKWRLTLYFVLAMLVATLIVEIAMIVFFQQVVDLTQLPDQLIQGQMRGLALQLEPFFALDAPPTMLQSWLEKRVPVREGGSGLALFFGVDSPPPQADTLPSDFDFLAITDLRGALLAANVAPALRQDWPTASFHDPLYPTASAAVIEQALAGEMVVQHQADGVILAAYPFYHTRSSPSSPAGVIYLRLISWASRGVIGRFLRLGLFVGSFFVGSFRLLPAIILGFLTASWLDRRLQALNAVTDAWGQGDFSIQVNDRSQDEIGQLARRLNRMAVQLQSVLEIREQLATLEERNRLARDLHDSVKQQVFATSMQVGAARALLDKNPTAAARHLAQAETLSHQAQQELTTLLRQLRPVALSGKGLAAALREHIDAWSQQHGILAQYQVKAERRLPLAVEQTLYRIAQEALANVARHSRTDHVDVQLHYERDRVILIVQDYGQGFDPTTARGKGQGLINMEERAAALHGKLIIDSQPGSGTRLTITLPTEISL